MTETDKTPRWKPIAEAPKDGTPVLLYLPDANDPQMDIGLFSDGEWLREFSFSTIDVEPTHFMDLPPAACAWRGGVMTTTTSANLTPVMVRVLTRAAKRARGSICPTPELPGNTQRVVLQALDRRGLIDPNKGSPRINDAGRVTLAILDYIDTRAKQEGL